MSQVDEEIREQPEALARLLDEGRQTVEMIAARAREFAPRFVVLVARGSSDNAARYAQYLFGARNGLAVALATPSLFTLYEPVPRLDGSLVLAICQSGQSPDIVAVVEEGRRQGALTVALTNDRSSPLASAAEHALPLPAPARAQASPPPRRTRLRCWRSPSSARRSRATASANGAAGSGPTDRAGRPLEPRRTTSRAAAAYAKLRLAS